MTSDSESKAKLADEMFATADDSLSFGVVSSDLVKEWSEKVRVLEASTSLDELAKTVEARIKCHEQNIREWEAETPQRSEIVRAGINRNKTEMEEDEWFLKAITEAKGGTSEK